MLDYQLLVIIAVIVALAATSWRDPLVMRNIFVVYCFAIYILGPWALDETLSPSLEWGFEYVGVIVVFLAGYFWSLFARDRRTKPLSPEEAFGRFQRWRRVFLTLVALNVVLLGFQIRSTGIAAYYAGQALVSLIANYGKADTQGALLQVLGFLLSVSATVCGAVMAELAAAVGTQPADRSSVIRSTMRTTALWFVVFPVVQFSRSGLVFGGLTYLALRARLTGRESRLMYAFIASGALAFFVYVGMTREQALGTSGFESKQLFVSELTPWSTYRSIRENMFQLHYQYGKTLGLPFVLRVIPRGLYPEKPQNSVGYVAQTLNPTAFESGFTVPATFAGDLYLNFGLVGVILGSLALGAYAGRIDRIVVRKQRERVGLFILAFGNFPSLLRDSLAATVFNLAIILAAYALFSAVARSRLRV